MEDQVKEKKWHDEKIQMSNSIEKCINNLQTILNLYKQVTYSESACIKNGWLKVIPVSKMEFSFNTKKLGVIIPPTMLLKNRYIPIEKEVKYKLSNRAVEAYKKKPKGKHSPLFWKEFNKKILKAQTTYNNQIHNNGIWDYGVVLPNIKFLKEIKTYKDGLRDTQQTYRQEHIGYYVTIDVGYITTLKRKKYPSISVNTLDSHLQQIERQYFKCLYDGKLKHIKKDKTFIFHNGIDKVAGEIIPYFSITYNGESNPVFTSHYLKYWKPRYPLLALKRSVILKDIKHLKNLIQRIDKICHDMDFLSRQKNILVKNTQKIQSLEKEIKNLQIDSIERKERCYANDGWLNKSIPQTIKKLWLEVKNNE